MPGPLVIAGLAGAAGAGLRYAGQRAQANAMMPEGWEEYLAQLEGGDLGLTPEQRASMEAQHTAQRGGAMADAQQRQLQQAQSMAGSGAIGARDLFLNDLATQQAQGQMLNQQTQQIQSAEIAAEERNREMMMELQQRQASSDAAKKQAAWNLGADVVSLGATTGLGAWGAKQMESANKAYLWAAGEDSKAGMRAAAMDAANAQMTMQLAGAYGGAAPTLPSYYQGALDSEQLPGDWLPTDTWPIYNARKLAEQAAAGGN